MRRVLFGLMAFTAVVLFVASPAVSQPPPGGKGGQKGPPRFELGQVFPPPLLAELQLTPAQEKELDAIKKELKTKLNKLLTVEQKKKVENFRPRGPGGPGGPGGKGGERPERPPLEPAGRTEVSARAIARMTVCCTACQKPKLTLK